MQEYLTKQQIVYKALRESIQSGELRPGEPLPLSRLAGKYSVSEIPVREALRQLEQEGLVDLRPHTQAVVKDITHEDWHWVAELRLVLEPMAVRQAVGRLSQADFEELERLIDEMERANRVGDSVAYQKLNGAFHDRIYSRTTNRRLHRILRELWSTAQRFGAVYRMPGHMDAGQAEHRELVAHLRAGDAVAAERAMRQHRLRIMQNLRSWVDDNLGKGVALKES